ncbi:MAG: hypothetical protein IJS14_01860 [Lentisphaeria bacterium]|nr:hypothetical protein [Lentisphaeria bacterium]
MVWLILTACLAGVLVYGQSSKRSSRRGGRSEMEFGVPEDSIKIELSLPRSPIYAVDSRKSRVGGNVPDMMRQWLMCEISFGFVSRSRQARPILLEKLNVELYLYADEPSRETDSPRWFAGKQTLHAVVFDPSVKQRRYWCSLFLPPANVYMSVPRDRSGKLSVGGLVGVVIITDKEGNILGIRVFGAGKGKIPTSRAKRLVSIVSDMRKKGEGAILLWPREKTPWQWLDADRFELPLTEFPAKTQEAARQPLPAAQNDGIEE